MLTGATKNGWLHKEPAVCRKTYRNTQTHGVKSIAVPPDFTLRAVNDVDVFDVTGLPLTYDPVTGE